MGISFAVPLSHFRTAKTREKTAKNRRFYRTQDKLRNSAKKGKPTTKFPIWLRMSDMSAALGNPIYFLTLFAGRSFGRDVRV